MEEIGLPDGRRTQLWTGRALSVQTDRRWRHERRPGPHAPT